MDADNSLYENLENYLFTFIRVLFCLCAVNILRFAGILLKLRELPLFSMDADNSLYENLENYLFTFIRVLFCLCAVNILRFAGILLPYLNRLCSEESAIMYGNHA